MAGYRSPSEVDGAEQIREHNHKETRKCVETVEAAAKAPDDRRSVQRCLSTHWIGDRGSRRPVPRIHSGRQPGEARSIARRPYGTARSEITSAGDFFCDYPRAGWSALTAVPESFRQTASSS